MTIPRKIRQKIVTAFKRLYRKNPDYQNIDPKAWYIAYDGVVASIKPYYRWSEAWRAARSFHQGANILKGETVIRKMMEINQKVEGV